VETNISVPALTLVRLLALWFQPFHFDFAELGRSGAAPLRYAGQIGFAGACWRIDNGWVGASS